MKIFIYLLNLRRGGMEKEAILLAKELIKNGDQVILAIAQGPNEYKDYLSRYSLEVKVLWKGQQPYFWTNIIGHAKSLKYFRNNFLADITVVFGTQALILARMAGLSPILVSAQNSNAMHWHGWRPGYLLLKYLEKWAFQDKTLRIIGCSKAVTKTYKKRFKIPQARITTIKNASELEIKTKDKVKVKNNNTILMVGTLYSQKNYPMAFNGVRILKENGTPCKLRIAGDGPELSSLKKLAQKMKIDDLVQFLGQRKDIASLMQHSSIFWLTSNYEGFGLVLVEAMIAGIPIIATRVPGISEVIADKHDGLLVEINDAENLAKKTLTILRDPSLAKKFKENGKKKALTFSAPFMGKSYRTIFNKFYSPNVGNKFE